MTTTTRTLLAAVALTAGLALPAGLALADGADLAGDPAAISDLAENCQICHGPMGKGSGEIKAIGGRSAAELTPLLIAMRDGKTPTTLMWRLMKPLTDGEIAALAADIATWK